MGVWLVRLLFDFGLNVSDCVDVVWFCELLVLFCIGFCVSLFCLCRFLVLRLLGLFLLFMFVDLV